MVHLLIGRRRDTKKPHLAAGISKIGLKPEVYRAHQSEAPEREAFFMTAWRAHEFVIMNGMMRCVGFVVNEGRRSFSS
jgi:hypothetical protein